MITPSFSCSQDETFVYINIKVSHIRFDAVGVQIIAENELFIFSLSPYYLRLRFSHRLIDDEERSQAKYDSKEECINVRIPKLNKGEIFEDLDLPKKLLARSGENVGNVLGATELLQQIGISESSGEVTQELSTLHGGQKPKPLIEEINSTSDLENIKQEGLDFNWEINQTLNEEDVSLKITYGFNNEYSSIVGVSISNGNDINELDDPEYTSTTDRIKERLLKENHKFDPEYYAAEFMSLKHPSGDNDSGYSSTDELLKWENPLLGEIMSFSEAENSKMMELPRRSYLIEDPRPLYYSILSLLFSYSFEIRETEGELNTESAWSIGKLTPQLADLDAQIILPGAKTPMIKAILITSVRRSLSYPLHRNYNLSLKAWKDVAQILNLGKNAVIKVLLIVHEAFRFHDVYYVYNKILLDDLINWLVIDSRDNDFVFKSLSNEVLKQLACLKKEDIVFEQLGEEGDVESMLNINEVEEIAEQMYLEQQEQQN